MKIVLKSIVLIFVLSSCISTKEVSTTNLPSQINKAFIGVWEFEGLYDEDGGKVDTIWHGLGYEIPQGPIIVFRENGTYSQQFTPKNIDKGKWSFDEETQAIIYLLYYDKPYDLVAQDLIRRGHAKKDENGDYYEIVTSEIDEYSENQLTLIERGNRRRTFKRRKE